MAERRQARTERPPLAELHCHIEGTAPPSLAREQAARHGVDIGALIQGDRYRWRGFTGFLDAYDRIAALFRTGDAYVRLASDYLTSIAAEGAIYAELFVSPDHARLAGLAPEAYVNALAEGLRKAEQESGIAARLVVVGIRHLGPDKVLAAARFAASCERSVVTGFGLAGDERIGRPADFAPAFSLARDAGLGLTAHAGEFAGAQAVRETIERLGVTRIGHGVRAIEDPGVVDLIVERGLTLEVCPGSNLALGLYPDLDRHPLRALHRAGVRLTLGSDDPPFFGTSLAKEYDLARQAGFSAPERLALTRNAIEAAFVDEATRRKLLDRLALAAISLGAAGTRG